MILAAASGRNRRESPAASGAGSPGGSDRCDQKAFSRDTLVALREIPFVGTSDLCSVLLGWIQVRAAWIAAAHDAVDLEIQLSASSVGELEGLEVGVRSLLDPPRRRFNRAALLRGSARSSRGLRGWRWPRARLATVPVRSTFRREAPSPQPAPAPQQRSHRCRHPRPVLHRNGSSRRSGQKGFDRADPHRNRHDSRRLDPLRSLRAGARERRDSSRASSRLLVPFPESEEHAVALYQDFLRQPPPLGP